MQSQTLMFEISFYGFLDNVVLSLRVQPSLQFALSQSRSREMVFDCTPVKCWRSAIQMPLLPTTFGFRSLPMPPLSRAAEPCDSSEPTVLFFKHDQTIRIISVDTPNFFGWHLWRLNTASRAY